MFSPWKLEHLAQEMLSCRNGPHPSVCPSPQDKDSLQILVEPEADSLPLMETNTYKVSLSSDLCWAGSLPLPAPAPATAAPAWPHTSFLRTQASESWDYVLVADRRTRRTQQFLENLKKKGFRYEVGQLRTGLLGVGRVLGRGLERRPVAMDDVGRFQGGREGPMRLHPR